MGQVCGVNTAGVLFVRDGITASNPTGTIWRLLNSPRFIHVSPGSGSIWGIDFTNTVYYYIGELFTN
jgi:hypothetical protein